ncbi:MAG: bifunctional phosphoribosylaminoimidazolecarboxamide formyltransferase/IMP cyclohydrolase [Bacteroidales bacterium]|nr:bifunctional phosphoribosylaminoimidazolecarboxamide formyltransferase/IMP cyclohydrolase [Bacteroidales bacterium]
MRDIKRALISIFNKEGIDELLKILDSHGVEILTTGGTYKYILEKGYKSSLVKVEDLTGYPSILGGRVKTLHPKVFGGILSRRNFKADIKDVVEYDIPAIDLVVVDLYPFEKTVASGASEDDIIEKIDIGGISLIRAAAKNHDDVVIVSEIGQMSSLVEELMVNDCKTTEAYRREMAKNAFAVSSHYDAAINDYFAGRTKNVLRYGENPHQSATFLGNLSEVFTQLHGKELSYNNLVDLDSGIRLINEFTEPAVAIIKHTNACGLAVRDNYKQAWIDALACDPVSAYGGVIFFNGSIDTVELAQEVNKIFFEIILANDYSEEALKILETKKNRIILQKNKYDFGEVSYKTILNGVLEQDTDTFTDREENFTYPTVERPSKEEVADLIFANILVKHTKSNAIVIARGGQLLGSGTGQTSRVDALRQAIEKAKAFGFDLNGAVMASDAFFPFADCVEMALNEGITAVIEPGGSIRDNDSIEFCNKHNMKMVFTGHRHFKH